MSKLGSKESDKYGYNNMKGNTVRNVADPIEAQDAVNRRYFDNNLPTSGTDGWNAYSTIVPTRASEDDPTFVLTFAGVDLTGNIGVGMRVKLTQGGTARYFIVTAISFSTNTTLTLYGGADYDVEDTGSFAISDFNYSTQKAPFGFLLDPDKWSIKVTDTTLRNQITTGTTWYYSGLGSINISIPIGIWNLTFQCLTSSSSADGVNHGQVALSTSTSSASDNELVSASKVYSNNIIYEDIKSNFFDKLLSIASKTSYYVIGRNTEGSSPSIFLYNTERTLVIRAVCAYL